ncbi:hypothetical protein GOBAR_DD13777 [Gossypium barbadense]|nr:hypothetical protein GOBAR_DD13777 [Gossypium barbadense]
MILRLQSGRSSVEIDVIQFKRMAEQKQEYDQQVIESLSMENYMQLCKQKLKLYMKDDELGPFELDASLYDFHDA